MQRPIMAYPPYHSNHTFPPHSVYPMWGGQPGSHTAGVPIWAPPPPGYPLWQQPTENWHWKPYPPAVIIPFAAEYTFFLSWIQFNMMQCNN